MTPDELLNLFRLETDDVAEPYLWSDLEFFTYLNEAQDTFVRRIGGIPDSSSPITKITYNANDEFIKYDERIMRIKSAKDSQNRRLTLANIDAFEGTSQDDDYGFTFAGGVGLDDGRTGPVRYLLTDLEEDKIRLYPLPDADGFIRLYVYRRPLYTVTDGDSLLEVPDFRRHCLLYWVKYRAYAKQDVETFDGAKAEDFLQMFNDSVDVAKKEKSSREDPKRVVAYGGIPMS
jgi:hypothetical protein